jgi:hypothetical protein
MVSASNGDEPGPSATGWQRLTYAFALTVALVLCYFLVKMPLQVSDDVTNLMSSQTRSVGDIIEAELGAGATYFRPMLTLTLNAAFEAGHAWGSYFAAAKAIQVLQVVLLLWLFARLLRVESAGDFAAAAVAIIAAVGIHTFFYTIHELYPVNTYMTILVCCLAMLVLCDGTPAWWRDVTAVLLFAFMIFTVETGVLLWVIALAGFAVGFRGVSLRAVGAMTGGVLLFVVIKFVWLSGELPGLDQRSASFGFRSYSPQELAAEFSDRRAVFYGANIISSVITVFTAEPRASLWRFTRALVDGGTLTAAMVLNVLTSTASSLLLVWFARTRWSNWRRWTFERGDRFVVVCLAVAIVNACVSYPYTKDAIVSPAGLLFALALFPAFAAARQRVERETRRPVAIGLAIALGLVSLGWTLRAAAVPYGLLRTAHDYQQEWVHLDRWLVEQQLTEYTPEQMEILGKVREEALSMDVPNPRVVGGWFPWAEWLFDRP